MHAAKCYRLSPEGLSLFVRVTPNAGQDAVEGIQTRGDGSVVLRVRVKAVPDKGRANAAVVSLLAKLLELAKSDLSVTAGETARLKTIAVRGDAEALGAKLTAYCGNSPQ